jgi:hypothetical protein
MAGYWVRTGPPKGNIKLSQYDKDRISAAFSGIIDDFKKQYVKENPNKEFNYLVDIFSRWRSNSFYLCERYKYGDHADLQGEFEYKFVRLQFIGKDCCHLSFMRYTGQWVLFAESQTIDACKEMIVSMSYFHPVG